MPTICRLISVGRLESVGATVGGGGSSGLEELGVSESSGAGCDSMAVPPSSSGLADASCSSDIPGQEVVARESQVGEGWDAPGHGSSEGNGQSVRVACQCHGSWTMIKEERLGAGLMRRKMTRWGRKERAKSEQPRERPRAHGPCLAFGKGTFPTGAKAFPSQESVVAKGW